MTNIISMKKFLIILLFAPLQLFSQRFDYLPAKAKGEIVRHSQYTLLYIEDCEQAAWVAYELTASEVRQKCDRTDDFREDPDVSTGSATLADYKGSGYDRGHLTPAADNKVNCPKAMSESFFMSNMSPQTPGFNRGVWRRLEELVRTWAISYNKLYIVSGPIFTNSPGFIGEDSVTIPSKFYKVILDLKRKKGIGFILDNRSSSADLRTFAVSIDEVEEVTNLDFFPALEDNLESQIEGNMDRNDWQW